MKSLFLAAILAIIFPVQAQAPAPVALKDEPHHNLIFENEYVRVWLFGIKGHDATLLHSHDLPYLGIALGPADFVNAVAGKPEVPVTLTDGQVGYSKGGFAHLVRTETDMPFRNFTVELLKPQGTGRNRCVNVVPGPLNDCPQQDPGQAPGSPSLASIKPLFETDDVLVESGVLAAQGKHTETSGRPARLLLVLDGSELSVEIPGLPAKTLHSGEALWLSAGLTPTLTNLAELKTSAFVLLVLKDSAEKK
jgi:hypothetical protein